MIGLLTGIKENLQLSEKNSHVEDGKLVTIDKRPVMECALDILAELVKHKKITIQAKGDSIPTAVAVANIITENMLRGSSKILDIIVDSESPDGNFALVSIIKITISKTI